MRVLGCNWLLSCEQLFERLAELFTHAAVDEEVERVGEQDEEVGEQAQCLGAEI